MTAAKEQRSSSGLLEMDKTVYKTFDPSITIICSLIPLRFIEPLIIK